MATPDVYAQMNALFGGSPRVGPNIYLPGTEAAAQEKQKKRHAQSLIDFITNSPEDHSQEINEGTIPSSIISSAAEMQQVAALQFPRDSSGTPEITTGDFTIPTDTVLASADTTTLPTLAGTTKISPEPSFVAPLSYPQAGNLGSKGVTELAETPGAIVRDRVDSTLDSEQSEFLGSSRSFSAPESLTEVLGKDWPQPYTEDITKSNEKAAKLVNSVIGTITGGIKSGVISEDKGALVNAGLFRIGDAITGGSLGEGSSITRAIDTIPDLIKNANNPFALIQLTNMSFKLGKMAEEMAKKFIPTGSQHIGDVFGAKISEVGQNLKETVQAIPSLLEENTYNALANTVVYGAGNPNVAGFSALHDDVVIVTNEKGSQVPQNIPLPLPGFIKGVQTVATGVGGLLAKYQEKLTPEQAYLKTDLDLATAITVSGVEYNNSYGSNNAAGYVTGNKEDSMAILNIKTDVPGLEGVVNQSVFYNLGILAKTGDPAAAVIRGEEAYGQDVDLLNAGREQELRDITRSLYPTVTEESVNKMSMHEIGGILEDATRENNKPVVDAKHDVMVGLALEAGTYAPKPDTTFIEMRNEMTTLDPYSQKQADYWAADDYDISTETTEAGETDWYV